MHAMTHLILPDSVRQISVRFREIKWLVHVHIAGVWPNWCSNPGLLIPNPSLSLLQLDSDHRNLEFEGSLEIFWRYLPFFNI